MSTIKKDNSYSSLLLTEGSATPIDDDAKYPMELPDWADEEKIKMGQTFFLLNLNSMTYAFIALFVAILSIPTILKILIFTKQSATPESAYKRYKASALHSQNWYQFKIKPGTNAWKSLEAIRKMHIFVNRRATKAGEGIISQKDMSIVLFVFMGFPLLMPDKFGIVGTREQFEAFNHFWRVIGYMLGMHDKFNCCGATLDVTLGRLEAIREDMLLPALTVEHPDYESYARIATEGLWCMNPIDSYYDSLMFMIKRAVGVPGYHFFKSESSGDEIEHQQKFRNLSILAKMKIFLDIVMYEYLSDYFIFRWIFNIIRFIVVLFDKYSILAIAKFSRKYAFVETIKSRKR